MSEAAPQLCKAALVAFLLGLSSLSPLSIVTALPALYLGVQAIRAINRSDGRLRGHRLAIAGLVLGAVVTLICVIGVPAMVLLLVQEYNLRAGCTNNLRQIGESIQVYHNHNDKTFPPGTVPNPSLKPEQRLSWEAAILPWLVESGPARKKWEKVAGAIAFKESWDAPANANLRHNVALFLCPVFAHELSPEQVGLSSYLGIAGVGRDAATLPLDDANAGFFGYDRVLHPSDITGSLAATMVAIETGQENGPWAAGGPATVRGIDSNCDRYVGKGAPFGGLHREGANVLWADGSVGIVTERKKQSLFRDEGRIAR
jgi:prepilin-type processing-associated H-X9-DG protein